MSFWPFPKILLDELRAGLEVGAGIDLGAGQGRLPARLRAAGIHLLAADLRPPADLRVDARALPFREGALGVVLLANLLRHLTCAERGAVLDQVAASLAPGGRVVVLEDDPRGRCAAENNYRRVLELLAKVDPTRGAALDLDGLASSPPAELDLRLDQRLENEEAPVDVTAPLRWVASRGHASDPGFAELEAAVARDGIEYGAFRVCVFVRR